MKRVMVLVALAFLYAEVAQAGEAMTIQSVAVTPGTGVTPDLQEAATQIIESYVSAGSVLTSEELDAKLVEARQEFIARGYSLAKIIRTGPNRGLAADGVLPLLVQMGTVRDVVVTFKGREPGEDGMYFSNRLMHKHFEHIHTGDVFNLGNLYLALHGFNAHPDLTANMRVKVSEDAETAEAGAKLYLEVEEDMPLHAALEVNNHAIDALDNWQAIGMVQYSNVSGVDDTFSLVPSMTLNGDQWSLASNYTRPFELWRGGMISFWGGFADTDLDDMRAGDLSLGYQSNGYFIGGQVSFQLLDSSRHDLQFFSGLQYRYTEQDLTWLGMALSEYQVGVLPFTVGLSYMSRTLDRLGGRNFLTVSGSVNVMDDHDRIEKIWPDAEEHYVVYRAQAARIQPLSGGMTLHQGFDAMWTLYLRLEAQYTQDPLIAQEQLLLGGPSNIRGYRVSSYAGDQSVYGTFEMRTPTWHNLVSGWFGAKHERQNDWIDGLQFLTFFDYGYLAWEEAPMMGLESDSVYLMSLGVGARLQLTKHASLSCDVAFPLKKHSDKDDHCEVYAGFRGQF